MVGNRTEDSRTTAIAGMSITAMGIASMIMIMTVIMPAQMNVRTNVVAFRQPASMRMRTASRSDKDRGEKQGEKPTADGVGWGNHK